MKKNLIYIVCFIFVCLNLCCKDNNIKAEPYTKNIYQQFIENVKKGDVSYVKSNINNINPIDTILIDSDSSRQFSLLGYACNFKQYDIVNILLENNANIEIAEDDGIYVYDALFLSINNKDYFLTKLLLEKGSNPNTIYTENGLTPLAISCQLGLVEITNLLIDHGAKLNGVTLFDVNYQIYPIIEAVKNGNVKIIKSLIDKGTDTDVINNEGESPLSIAEAKGDIFLIDLITHNNSIKSSSWCINNDQSSFIIEDNYYAIMTVIPNQVYFKVKKIKKEKSRIYYKLHSITMNCQECDYDNDENFYNDEPILYVDILDSDELRFTWLGFYFSKTGKRIYTENPFGTNKNFTIMQRCQ